MGCYGDRKGNNLVTGKGRDCSGQELISKILAREIGLTYRVACRMYSWVVGCRTNVGILKLIKPPHFLISAIVNGALGCML